MQQVTIKKKKAMKVYREINLESFEFWAGAKANAAMLTRDELCAIDEVIEECYPEGVDETWVNDLFWFCFDEACAMIGLEYDCDEDKVIREEDE